MISFFVTATDTDVGKTYISKGLACAFSKLGKRVGYFKPFQSGIVKNESTDAEIIREACKDAAIKNSYITKTPSAPSLSAKIDGVEIKLEKVKNDYEDFKKGLDVVIAEGSGGLYVPVTPNKLMSDTIKMLKIPVLVVARPNLGTVNHTLMTLKCLETEDIKVLGVVISGYPEGSNDPSILNAKKMIERYSNHKVLSQIPKNAVEDDFKPLINLLEEAVRQQL